MIFESYFRGGSISFDRAAQVEPSADAELGQVSGILASGGEASDGHILNVRGGETRSGLPLLWMHWSDEPLGTWSTFEVLRGDQAADDRLRAHGSIELEAGAGAKLEARQDVAAMVAAHRITGLSLRWDAEEKDVKRRTNLPSDHPAYVDPDDRNAGRRRWGLYFEKWRAIEGSIVTTPSDQEALVGRAEGAEDVFVRDFYRATLDRLSLLGEDPLAAVQGVREVLEGLELGIRGELAELRAMLQASGGRPSAVETPRAGLPAAPSSGSSELLDLRAEIQAELARFVETFREAAQAELRSVFGR